MYAARAAYNRTSGFAKQNGGLTGRQANQTEFLTRPLMVHQSTPCKKLQGVFLLLYFKKARSGAASEILEQGGGTQCRKERHSAAFLSPRESPRECGGCGKARRWGEAGP